ncbi:MAG TPA: 3-hydroxyacyl-CoA dehydrogenase NAD-binding domain-containing protein [Saprospiraceae bacterium]|nr:3-hydroxyacyl-CoA dehydrogenase NAD-binding domain-containing protein [Saprospiraceae bacterium]
MINQIAVIGAGAMGTGIAQVFASFGYETILYDLNQDSLVKSRNKLQDVFNMLVQKGKITDSEAKSSFSRIHFASSLAGVKNADLVIEAIIEKLEVKQSLFKELEGLVSESCILASNTSSLSVTSIASACNRPGRVIGLHFFNPVPLMKLVEIIPAVQTHTATIETCKKLVDGIMKYGVLAKDTPGFIVNKVARPFYSESFRIYEEGIADFATIDWALTEFGGFKMGPFTLTDFIGHDVNYTVTESVWTAFYFDPRYTPAFCQKKLVEAGYLGKKAGKGFYDYSENSQNPSPLQDENLGKSIFHRVHAMLVNEAADTIHRGICTLEDVETAMTKGVNYPKGLINWGEELGYDYIVELLDGLYDYYHEARYRVSPYLRNKINS